MNFVINFGVILFLVIILLFLSFVFGVLAALHCFNKFKQVKFDCEELEPCECLIDRIKEKLEEDKLNNND